MDCLEDQCEVAPRKLRMLKLEQENVKDASLSLRKHQEIVCTISSMSHDWYPIALSLQTIQACFAVGK